MLVLLPLGLLFRAPRTDPRLIDTGMIRIRCPLCGWQPAKTDRWVCSPGCGHLWNTFETRGVCPACAKHWVPMSRPKSKSGSMTIQSCPPSGAAM
jgi:hypothetical protein